MVKGWISHVLWTFLLFPLQKYFLQKFWNSSQQLQRCTSNDFCISRSPIVLGKRCHLSKMPFQFNQWPAKFNSFSVLKGQKSYWENTGGDGSVAMNFWAAKNNECLVSNVHRMCFAILDCQVQYIMAIWLWQNLK